jgi:hypothetical protein
LTVTPPGVVDPATALKVAAVTARMTDGGPTEGSVQAIPIAATTTVAR